jgi:integrase
MTPKMERTRYPGIYKRGGRYVVVWTHRGRQHKSFHATIAEARDAKGRRAAGDRRPTSKVLVADYFADWIESYAGRTTRGFSETSRSLYRRSISDHALGRWGRWKLAEVEPADVRSLCGALRAEGVSISGMRGVRAALSAMFATAVEDGLLPANPIAGVRIPATPSEDADEGIAKALSRAELGLFLAALPRSRRLFFEFLTHSGLRISEAIGLTWEHVELGRRPRVLVREQLYNASAVA